MANNHIVLEKTDVDNYLNNSERRKLEMMITKIGRLRAKEGKPTDVEIDTRPENIAEDKEVIQLIYKAVEKALKAEREKIKKAIPNERVVITPDPEVVDNEGAEKIAYALANGASPEEIKEIEEKHPLNPAPKKKATVKKKTVKKKSGVNNASDKS